MMQRLLVVLVGVIILLLIVVILALLRKRMSPAAYKEKWVELQRFCSSKETWPLAIISADKLLDEALKKRRLKGKSMGERLVSGQRVFSDNDGIWFAHNLAKKLMEDSVLRLKQADVKKSLLGVRQALKDLGVME